MAATCAFGQTPPAEALSAPRVRVEAEPEDQEVAKTYVRMAEEAERRIAAFFGKGFRKTLTIQICSSRAAFDRALAKAWGMPATQPWMVGAAGADRVYFLSPRVWKAEAHEHDPNDAGAMSRLVAHELVHAYHAQFNPTRDLDGLDPMAWFVEGLATFVSGQESTQHAGRAKALLTSSSFPNSLETIWAGPSRYALAGSLVRFVETRFGRPRVVRLLSATTNAEALQVLGTTESELLREWKAWLAGS